jgi:hypothetical protein
MGERREGVKITKELKERKKVDEGLIYGRIYSSFNFSMLYYTSSVLLLCNKKFNIYGVISVSTCCWP